MISYIRTGGLDLNTLVVRVLLPVVLLVVFYVGWNYSLSDKLPGFFDDSSVYLIAASIYSSDSINISPHFLDSYLHHRHLPPGFPLVLAIFGGGDIYSAHLLVLIEFIILLLVIYGYYTLNTGDRYAGILLLIIYASLPGNWLEILKIMSEMQYMMLSYAVLYMHQLKKTGGVFHYLLLGVFTGIVILTRTIGIALFFAIIVSYVGTWMRNRGHIGNILVYMFCVMVVITSWKIVSKDLHGSYLDSLGYLSNSNVIKSLLMVIMNNLVAYWDAFIYLLSVFKTSDTILSGLVYITLISIGVVGCLVRSRKVDGLYVIFYMTITLFWPYSNDMSRLMYPLAPMVPLYIWIGSRYLRSRLKMKEIYAYIPLLIIISLSVPALKYIYERNMQGRHVYDESISHLPKYYQVSDHRQAFAVSVTSLQYMEFIASIKDYVGNDRVLSLKPEILTFMGNVKARRLPVYNENVSQEEFVENVLSSGAKYVFLNGMSFSSDPYGMKVLEVLRPYVKIVYIDDYKVSSHPALALLEIERASPSTGL